MPLIPPVKPEPVKIERTPRAAKPKTERAPRAAKPKTERAAKPEREPKRERASWVDNPELFKPSSSFSGFYLAQLGSSPEFALIGIRVENVDGEKIEVRHKIVDANLSIDGDILFSTISSVEHDYVNRFALKYSLSADEVYLKSNSRTNAIVRASSVRTQAYLIAEKVKRNSGEDSNAELEVIDNRLKARLKQIRLAAKSRSEALTV